MISLSDFLHTFQLLKVNKTFFILTFYISHKCVKSSSISLIKTCSYKLKPHLYGSNGIIFTMEPNSKIFLNMWNLLHGTYYFLPCFTCFFKFLISFYIEANSVSFCFLLSKSLHPTLVVAFSWHL